MTKIKILNNLILLQICFLHYFLLSKGGKNFHETFKTALHFKAIKAKLETNFMDNFRITTLIKLFIINNQLVLSFTFKYEFLIIY